MLSGGMLLSLGITHLLVDAVADWVQPNETSAEVRRRLHATSDGINEYPTIFAIFLAGIIMPLAVLLLNGAIVDYYEVSEGKCLDSVDHPEIPAHLGETPVLNHEVSESSKGNRGNIFFVKFLLLTGAVILHSVIIGFGLGSMREEELVSIEALLVALAFHQFFEGISLGTLLVELNMSHGMQTSLIFKMGAVLIFYIATPLGIIVAITTVQDGINNTSAGFNAFAAGILVYGALVDVLTAEIDKKPSNGKVDVFQKPLMFVALIIGCGIMSLLAIWA